MNKIILSLLLTGIICYLASCEKDDICVEGDTPLLILEFYDIDDTTETKTVTDLRVQGLQSDTPYNPGINENNRNSFRDRANVSSVSIPLRIDSVATTFLLIRESADSTANEIVFETGNIDTLKFDYVLNEDFISRACGFIVNYSNLTSSLTTDTDNWIQDIIINDSTVQNLDTLHVKIFH